MFFQFIKRVLKRKSWRRIPGRFISRHTLILRAFLWRRLLFNTTFIAITGSVGKSTTKEFLSAILAQKFPVMRTPGNWNLRLSRGLEHTILRTRPWHKFAVIEIGTQRPGDVQSAAKFLKPDIAIVLDIKRCHTNVFKSLDAIAREKAHLLKELKPGGCAILNQDNSHIAAMEVLPRAKLLFFGQIEGADYQLLAAESKWPERLKLAILHDSTKYDIETRLAGTHWSNTILASIAAAHHCGITLPDIMRAIRQIEPFWARMQPITLPNEATIIRDDWNGSIDTYEGALRFMDDAEALRKIVVFSDYSDSPKRLRVRAKHLGQIAAQHADAAIFVGNYAERSRQSAIKAGLSSNSVHGFHTIADATRFLKNELRSGDLVLIKGQCNHHLTRIYLGLIGEVTCTLPNCSRQRICDCCSKLGFKWTPEMTTLRAAPGSGL
jgi:UDP-N-acetylmuramoyl-tripeptide--D-alanyl-D-alanine ligase